VKTTHRLALVGSLVLANACASGVHAQEALADNPLATPDGLQPVLTPTRLRQAPRDVPASMTVLTAEMLAAYGFVGVNEAVRMVAGGGPQRLAGANYDLKLPDNKRSSSGPPHVTLLIDGVQVGGDVLNEDEEWVDVPITIDDVERIEVTRGPGTAGYGYAVTMAIVNIVTKHPADIERAYGRITYGAYDTTRVLARAGLSLGPGAVRVTLSHRQRGEVTDDRASTARPDPMTLDRITVRSSLVLDPASSLAVDLSYLYGEREGDAAAAEPLGHETLRSGYARVAWTRALDVSNEMSLHVEQWANTQDTGPAGCDAEGEAALARPTLASLYGAPEAKAEDCTGTLVYQRRMRMELQDVHVFDNGVRLVGGVGWRQEQARLRDPDLLRWSTSFRRAFAAVEWMAVPDVTVNLGASLDDGAAANHDRAMRAGVNWRMSTDQTWRAAWSLGDWASDKGRVLAVGGNANVVTQERMQGWDVGYLHTLPDRNATIEARLYWTRLKGSIWNPRKPQAPEEKARGEIYGGEFRASGDLSDRWAGFLGLSTMIEGANTGTDVGDRPRPWSASAGLSTDLGGGWRAAAAYYASTRLNASAQTAGRADLVLTKDFRWDEVRARALASYRRADHLRVMGPDGKIIDRNGTADGYFFSLQMAF
jgi:iron complex outermembrane receptor protein